MKGYLSLSHLEHLNKGNTEIEIGHITTDQAQAEEQTDGNNGTEVNPTGHLDCFPAIKEGSCTRENLGHEGRKGQMPSCKADR